MIMSPTPQDLSIEEIRLHLQQKINENLLPPYVYTYPPKGSYQNADNWQDLLHAWREVTHAINLYIHIPFCFMKCSFCDLFTMLIKNNELIESYVDVLISELKIVLPYLNLNSLELQSIYFGGGTPSLLNYSQLEKILTVIRENFTLHPSIDISIEGTPDSFTSQKLAELKKLGFTRLSIGIESFDEEELIDMGRKYDPALSQFALKEAMQCDFKNVNIDLIYGLPGQTFENWATNLDIATQFNPNTITAYPFVTRNRTSYGKQLKNASRGDIVSNKTRYEWYEYTKKLLEERNYKQKTFVTFARDNGGCSHEQNEFQGISTLALGAGARSYTPSLHYAKDDYLDRKPNRIIIQDYIEKIKQGILPIRSIVRLNDEEKQIRYAILALLSSGIELSQYEKLFNNTIDDTFGNLLQALILENLIVKANGKINLTQRGLQYSSLIASHFASQTVKINRNKYY